MSVPSVRGMKDLLPSASRKWAALEAEFRVYAGRFGFAEIRTPILERTELFARSVGETTDIVEKEMYSFTDRGGEQLTLRPEATAGGARPLVSGGPAQPLPLKYFCPRQTFRYERPPKGRLRPCPYTQT